MPVTSTSVIVATATASWMTPESVTRQRARRIVFRLICDGLATVGEPSRARSTPAGAAPHRVRESLRAALRWPERNGELGQPG